MEKTTGDSPAAPAPAACPDDIIAAILTKSKHQKRCPICTTPADPQAMNCLACKHAFDLRSHHPVPSPPPGLPKASPIAVPFKFTPSAATRAAGNGVEITPPVPPSLSLGKNAAATGRALASRPQPSPLPCVPRLPRRLPAVASAAANKADLELSGPWLSFGTPTPGVFSALGDGIRSDSNVHGKKEKGIWVGAGQLPAGTSGGGGELSSRGILSDSDRDEDGARRSKRKAIAVDCTRPSMGSARKQGVAGGFAYGGGGDGGEVLKAPLVHDRGQRFTLGESHSARGTRKKGRGRSRNRSPLPVGSRTQGTGIAAKTFTFHREGSTSLLAPTPRWSNGIKATGETGEDGGEAAPQHGAEGGDTARREDETDDDDGPFEVGSSDRAGETVRVRNSAMLCLEIGQYPKRDDI